MNENPWQVDSVQAFAFLNCPECTFKTREETFFQEHAVNTHPMCFVLFGQTEVIVEEVTIDDSNKREYYIEVKGNEVPSKEELATALASFEDNSIIENESANTLTASIVKNETKVLVQFEDQIDQQETVRNEIIEREEETEDLKPQIKPVFKKEKKSLSQLLENLDDSDRFTCYYCDKEFSNRKYLHLHYKKHLDSNGKLPCRHCEKTAATFRKIQSHIYQHHNPYECKECNKTFVNQGSYARHRRTIHANKSLKKFQCEHCHYSTHARQYLHEHKQRVHTSKVQNQRDPIKFICGECQGAFTNRGPLQHHVCDTNIKKDTERLYKCPRCSGVFKHGFFISHHKRSHGGFPDGYEDIPKVNCDQCPEQFLTKTSLDQHKSNMHSAEALLTYANLFCDKCDNEPEFRNPTMLIKHYRDDHGSFPPMFENKPKFICSHCSNIYISEKSLKAHAFTAHSKKPKRIGPKIEVQCSFCEKTYGTKQRLRDHVIMEHENSAKYECGVCHRKLPTAGKLKDHMKQVHTKVTCEICEEVQYNWFYLKRHKASIHGIMPRDAIKCRLCPLIFKSDISLKKHLAAKHGSNY